MKTEATAARNLAFEYIDLPIMAVGVIPVGMLRLGHALQRLCRCVHLEQRDLPSLPVREVPPTFSTEDEQHGGRAPLEEPSWRETPRANRLLAGLAYLAPSRRIRSARTFEARLICRPLIPWTQPV